MLFTKSAPGAFIIFLCACFTFYSTHTTDELTFFYDFSVRGEMDKYKSLMFLNSMLHCVLQDVTENQLEHKSVQYYRRGKTHTNQGTKHWCWRCMCKSTTKLYEAQTKRQNSFGCSVVEWLKARPMLAMPKAVIGRLIPSRADLYCESFPQSLSPPSCHSSLSSQLGRTVARQKLPHRISFF